MNKEQSMKDTYIRIRLSERDKEIIKQDAEAQQMSMSEYIINLVRREHEKKEA